MPTAGETPASAAASSLVSPLETAIQNTCRCSRRHTGGLPGEYSGGRPVCSCTHVADRPITTPQIEVLRGPLDDSTYTSGRYRATCADLGLAQSTGRTGSCLDNAVAESFFASLKQELGRRRFTSRADARQAIFVWINYYNHRRLHSACGYRPPVEYEHVLAADPEPIPSPMAA